MSPTVNDKRVGIIIGGSGLIGGALLAYLNSCDLGVEVLAPNSKRLNLAKAESVERYFERYSPAFIINAAIAAIDSSAALAYEVNYSGTLRLAEVAIQYGVPLIHMSSAAVMATGEGLDENERLSLTPLLANYAKSKVMAEQSLEHMAKAAGLDYSIVRLAIVYGKHDHKIQGFHRLLFSIADQAMPLLLTKKNVKHSYSNLRKIGPFVHHLLQHRTESSGHIYNFADPEPVELATLILTVKKLMGLATPKPIYVPLAWAKMGKYIVSWLIEHLSRIGIEAKMPGEIQFLEQFYLSQTMAVHKVERSTFKDPAPGETVLSVLPTLIEYYVARWEKLNLIHTFNAEFYSSEECRVEQFRADPEGLLKEVHHRVDEKLKNNSSGTG